jgi:transglutaminase-like putative cysteine protease
MTLYDIDLRLGYEYASGVAGGRHLLRLMPADLPGRQRLVTGHLSARPEPTERFDARDFFGNRTTEIAWRASHVEIDIRLQARVERISDRVEFDISPPIDGLLREVRAVRSLAADSPHHFLRGSPRVPLHAEITAYAQKSTRESRSAVAAVAALGRALQADMRFDAKATTVDTSPIDAFRARGGVCQDFSHVMIAGLRGLGIPAGYVSGFLRTIPPEGEERLEGADAMHAWVCAWCGTQAGWVEFDPTNDLWVDTDHVVVAYGRDYGDVAPMKGVLRSSGGQQKGTHTVDVIAVAA